MHYFYVVFVFKQKTAYEMRISDWSSDVCSSDLLADLVALPIDDHRPLADRLATGDGEADALGDRAVGELALDPGRAREAAFGFAPLGDSEKIGRASCRERVCQYV